MQPSPGDIVKVKNVSSNAEILNNTCPEIFDTSPRPGGFLKVMVPTRSQDFIADSCPCPTGEQVSPKKSAASFTSSRYDQNSPVLSNTTSREFRLRRAIEETDWELTAVDETDTVVGISSTFHDTINMLAVSISCVMLMAADLQVPEDYLVWAQSYLQCIKDDEGINPPNVQGLIREIIKRRDPNYTPDKKGKEPKWKGESHSGKPGHSKHKPPSPKESKKKETRDQETDVNVLTVEKPSSAILIT